MIINSISPVRSRQNRQADRTRAHIEEEAGRARSGADVLATPGLRAGLFAALKAQERPLLQEIKELEAS
jgi:hypothetical protein